MNQSTDNVDNSECFCILSNVMDPSWSRRISIDNEDTLCCGWPLVGPALTLALVETLIQCRRVLNLHGVHCTALVWI